MKTSALWTFGLLFISLSGAHGLDKFPTNYVVAKTENQDPITLTCSSKTGESVTWKHKGEEIDEDLEDLFQLDGPNLTVLEVDEPTLGEYSCWRGEEKLSSTYLLLEAEKGVELDSFLSCRAKSYDCVFTCNWIQGNHKLVRLGLGQDCSEGGKSCHWVTSSLSDGEFQFEVSHSLSPYAEESSMLELTAEAIIGSSMLRRTKRFYLRDIVKPDSPQIVKCQEVGQNLNVTIDPPSTWSTPHSFFSLEHEIEYELQDNGQNKTSLSAVIPKRIRRLRARSRDPLVNSTWSQWTSWRNVTTRNRKQDKCTNTAKSCCPEILRCKKKGRKNKGKKEIKKIETPKKGHQ
ncbi:interleukin-12 subunit beta [Xyrichtys novacula]|uniref:Interleukin-12 subunit beta n=1 Tax=Xyrichtys novacula TaxID=13765 RepID=A0AAV1G890_XYRNO|nr:interleukin-12 subunit beta [Xyrichtys novacula]